MWLKCWPGLQIASYKAVPMDPPTHCSAMADPNDQSLVATDVALERAEEAQKFFLVP